MTKADNLILGMIVGIAFTIGACVYVTSNSPIKTANFKVKYVWLERQCRRCPLPVDGGAVGIISLDERFDVGDTVRYEEQNVVIIKKY